MSAKVSRGDSRTKSCSAPGRGTTSMASHAFRSHRTASPGRGGSAASRALATTTISSSRDFSTRRPSGAVRSKIAVSPQVSRGSVDFATSTFRSLASSTGSPTPSAPASTSGPSRTARCPWPWDTSAILSPA